MRNGFRQHQHNAAALRHNVCGGRGVFIRTFRPDNQCAAFLRLPLIRVFRLPPLWILRLS